MKKVAIKRTFALALIIMLGGISISKAQEMKRHDRGDEMREHHREMRGPKIPDLTETQEAKLKSLKMTHEKEILPLHNELNELEARMRTLTTSEEKKSDELGRVIDNMGDIKTELMKKRVFHMEEMKEILTEEQVLFLNKQMARKKSRAGKRPARRK